MWNYSGSAPPDMSPEAWMENVMEETRRLFPSCKDIFRERDLSREDVVFSGSNVCPLFWATTLLSGLPAACICLQSAPRQMTTSRKDAEDRIHLSRMIQEGSANSTCSSLEMGTIGTCKRRKIVLTRSPGHAVLFVAMLWLAREHSLNISYPLGRSAKAYR